MLSLQNRLEAHAKEKITFKLNNWMQIYGGNDVSLVIYAL